MYSTVYRIVVNWQKQKRRD